MNDKPTEGQFISLLEKAAYRCKEAVVTRRNWDEFMVVGDTHGHYMSTIYALEISEVLDIPIVFLGDYVDRGPEQLKNLCAVLEAKLERPDEVVLLRGNHEDIQLNEYYGFMDVINAHYSRFVLGYLEELYRSLPLAVVMSEKYFLTHAGIPSETIEINHLQSTSEDDLAYQELLWNDPSEETDWYMINHFRGCYSYFGYKAVEEFLKVNDLSYIIRGHMCDPEGYRWYFDDKLLSIFSSPNYCENDKACYALVMNEKPEARRLLKVY